MATTELQSQFTDDLVRSHLLAKVESELAVLDPARNPSGFSTKGHLPTPVSKEVREIYKGIYSDTDLVKYPTDEKLAQIALLLEDTNQTSDAMAIDQRGVPTNFFTSEYCNDAEHYFAHAVEQIEYGFSPGKHQLVSVYHDSSGNPLFLRKRVYAATALTLDRVRFRGIDLPPGVLIDVRPEDDKALTTTTGRIESSLRTTFKSIEFRPEVDAVLPLRLSGFVYPNPIDRALFATIHMPTFSPYESLHVEQSLVESVVEFDLDRIQKAARTLLDACGITN